jgi:hypothetical protein
MKKPESGRRRPELREIARSIGAARVPEGDVLERLLESLSEVGCIRV